MSLSRNVWPDLQLDFMLFLPLDCLVIVSLSNISAFLGSHLSEMLQMNNASCVNLQQMSSSYPKEAAYILPEFWRSELHELNFEETRLRTSPFVRLQSSLLSTGPESIDRVCFIQTVAECHNAVRHHSFCSHWHFGQQHYNA